MHNSKIKVCGRCKTSLICRADDIAQCDCSKIVLHVEVKSFLSKTKYDCLCNKCLTELNALMEQCKNYSFPKNRNEMIENIHYYIENGYFVFTELYHILRGKCCESGCRHCAYGYKNK